MTACFSVTCLSLFSVLRVSLPDCCCCLSPSLPMCSLVCYSFISYLAGGKEMQRGATTECTRTCVHPYLCDSCARLSVSPLVTRRSLCRMTHTFLLHLTLRISLSLSVCVRVFSLSVVISFSLASLQRADSHSTRLLPPAPLAVC